MADPSMAAAMERDMRSKFFIALALTIPTVLYSPMGVNILGLSLPTFGLSMDVIMLVLTTPVVFYCGWMFIAGAYHSLRRRALNMSVLVATGVLAAYGGSLALMLLGQETFFEAAAMLVTFVLFGHWMEMRARRGTSDALRALFDLVPPQAAVIRDGQELNIPSTEVVVGDTVVLRPGATPAQQARAQLGSAGAGSGPLRTALGAGLGSLLPLLLASGSMRLAARLTGTPVLAPPEGISIPRAALANAVLTALVAAAVTQITGWVARDARALEHTVRSS